ncbi:MAG: hypothetical protein MJZ98_00645 [Paludibacteraceae bacterium]|nr:hypothetical protein [Paludibacteraceae bacterium]
MAKNKRTKKEKKHPIAGVPLDLSVFPILLNLANSLHFSKTGNLPN